MAANLQRGGNTLEERDLEGWSLLARFLKVLEEVSARVPASRREAHGLRTLERRSYLGLFLFGLFNPVVSSMRALCAASALPRVQKLVGRDAPVALSRFSEAQQVFAPDILQPVLGALLERSAAREVINLKFGRINSQIMRVVDSTVWKVIPRMQWAQWRHQSVEQNALRLHVKLRLCDLQPTSAVITTGKTCERAALRAHLQAGEFYIGDRYYGIDYGLFDELRAKGCGFVLRVRNEAVVQAVEHHAISAAARVQGVSLDARVMLGSKHDKGPWRMVIFQRPGMKESVMLVCSEECAELSAEEVMELYRHRWQVEMFFRWLKCLVPCRHWFAESREGVTLQVYLALIEALLLAELIERKPNKRMMELLQWHQLGWAGEADVVKGIAREQGVIERRRAKKSK